MNKGLSHEERVEDYYQVSARVLAESLVDTEDQLERYESAPSVVMNFGTEDGGKEGTIKLVMVYDGDLFEEESWDPDGFMLALGALLRENF